MLVDFGGQHDDRQAGRGELAEQRVDVLLGADVDAARRVVEQEHLRVGGQGAGDDDLLLVTAGQRGDRVLVAAEPDLEPVSVGGEPCCRSASEDQAGLAVPGQGRGGEVLADRERREDRLVASVPGYVGGPDVLVLG